jgi:hypothetical protein
MCGTLPIPGLRRDHPHGCRCVAELGAAVCRELTKTYEQVLRGPLHELASWAAENKVRGEITVVLTGAAPTVESLVGAVRERVADGAPTVWAATCPIVGGAPCCRASALATGSAATSESSPPGAGGRLDGSPRSPPCLAASTGCAARALVPSWPQLRCQQVP